MKKAFTLVELLIVVAILGIMAAIVMPLLGGHVQEARESAAKDNLRVLRNVIGAYAAQNNDVPPGYNDNDPSKVASGALFLYYLTVTTNYLKEIPENPFNGLSLVKPYQDGESMPAEPQQTEIYGWLYHPATRDIRLNWTGTDSKGVSYFSY